MKAFNNLPNSQSNATISTATFNIDGNAVGAGGGFLMSFNMEFLEQDEDFRSAMNLQNNTIQLNFTKAGTTASTATGVFYCYAIYEQINSSLTKWCYYKCQKWKNN